MPIRGLVDTDTGAAVDIPVSTTAIHVSKAGSDASDGLSNLQPKLTISAALTAAAALSPTSSNLVVVQVLDAGIYTESLTMSSYVHLHAPSAKLVGSITHALHSSVVLNEHEMNATGCALNTAQFGTAYYSANRIDVTAGFGFVNINFGALLIDVKTAVISAGAYLTQSAAGQDGHMHYSGEDVYLDGAATGFYVVATGATTQVRVAHILQIGATTGGTGFRLIGGSVVADCQTVSASTAWNVSGGELDITCQDSSGTKTVSGTGVLRDRWHEISNGDIDTGTDTTEGTITAEKLVRAVEGHAPDDAPTPRGAAWTDLTSITLDQKRHTYTNGSADLLSVASPADGQWAIVEIVSAGAITSSLTFLGGSDENNITAGSELLLRTDGTTVWASVVEPSA